MAWHADAKTREVEAETGCLVIMSHIGSFEALRVPTVRQVRLPIRIVMDRRHNAAATDLLESLDPDLARGVIDASDGGPSLLGFPIYLGFGLYRGGGCYECHLEQFSKRIELPRDRRQEALQACAQRYAARMEHHLRSAPYNWFNWYPYWTPSESDDSHA